MGDEPTGEGRIWPEYWIDCCRCEFHMPLGRREYVRAAAEARGLGWTQTAGGKWACPDHGDAGRRALATQEKETDDAG